MSEQQVTITPHPASTSNWSALLDAAKVVPLVTFLGGFILYLLGFIIWNAYLSRYGVFASGLSSLDYFAAALSYLGYTVTIGLPFWILTHVLTAVEGQSRQSTLRNGTFWAMWGLIIYRIPTFYFSAETLTAAQGKVAVAIIILLLLHVFAASYFKRKHPEAKSTTILRNPIWFAIYLDFYSILSLSLSPSVSGFFFVEAILFYLVVSISIGGESVLKGRVLVTREVKALYVIFVVLLLLINAVSFGSRQFPTVQRMAGGGKPVPALLCFASDAQMLIATKKPGDSQTPFACRLLAETTSSYYVLARGEKGVEKVIQIAKSRVMAIEFPTHYSPLLFEDSTDK